LATEVRAARVYAMGGRCLQRCDHPLAILGRAAWAAPFPLGYLFVFTFWGGWVRLDCYHFPRKPVGYVECMAVVHGNAITKMPKACDCNCMLGCHCGEFSLRQYRKVAMYPKVHIGIMRMYTTINRYI
jgi:hypothetical protein